MPPLLAPVDLAVAGDLGADDLDLLVAGDLSSDFCYLPPAAADLPVAPPLGVTSLEAAAPPFLAAVDGAFLVPVPAPFFSSSLSLSLRLLPADSCTNGCDLCELSLTCSFSAPLAADYDLDLDLPALSLAALPPAAFLGVAPPAYLPPLAAPVTLAAVCLIGDLVSSLWTDYGLD